MLTALLMGGSKKIISEAESEIFQPDTTEEMDIDQAVDHCTIEARAQILAPKASLEFKSSSESTLIGRPRNKANISGIELSVPGQFTSKFAKLNKEGGFDLTSSDKQVASFDEKSDTEIKQSLPIEESIQDLERKRIRHSPADFHNKEKQQVGFNTRRQANKEMFEEVLRTYTIEETSRAATLSKQR